MTQVLTAKTARRGSRHLFFPAHIFSSLQPFPSLHKCVLSSCCHPAPSESWPWPCQQSQSNWTEWEVNLRLVITCWLKAQMAQTAARCLCISNPRSLPDRPKRQTWKPEKLTARTRSSCMQIWSTILAATMKELKHWSQFHRQGLWCHCSMMRDRVKKWTGCNDLKCSPWQKQPDKGFCYQQVWPTTQRIKKRGHRRDNGTCADWLSSPPKDFWYISLRLWFILEDLLSVSGLRVALQGKHDWCTPVKIYSWAAMILNLLTHRETVHLSFRQD